MSSVTDIYDDFPGDFFKAAELEGKKPKPFTITKVEKAEMNDGKQKPVLYFAEDDRGLVLNKENRDVLAERFGRDPRTWRGKTVTLVTGRVRGPNGPCPGIRFADLPIGEQIDEPNPADGPDDSYPGDWAPLDEQAEMVPSTPTARPVAKAAAPTRRKAHN